ncbi:MAG: hypothetical protein ACK5NT_16040 [Pyrinomonadaceae bacterium]
MKRFVSLAATLAVFMVAFSYTAFANQRSTVKPSSFKTTQTKPIGSVAPINCYIGGLLCDAARETALTVIKLSSEICSKRGAASQDCKEALINTDLAQNVAFRTCLYEALLEDIKD